MRPSARFIAAVRSRMAVLNSSSVSSDVKLSVSATSVDHPVDPAVGVQQPRDLFHHVPASAGLADEKQDLVDGIDEGNPWSVPILARSHF